MKKIVSMLLAFALCLCLLEIPTGNLPKRGDTPDIPGFSTVEPEKPKEPVRPMDDDEGPGERNEAV